MGRLGFVAAGVALLACFSAGAAATYDIPCTFTAQIVMHAKYNGHNYVYNFTQYSINGTAMAQEGIVPQGYPTASSKLIYKPPRSYTVIDPMFDDHKACAVLPVSYSTFPCPAMDFDAMIDAHNTTCPRGSVYFGTKQRCDRWRYRDVKEAYVTWYFLAGTFTPVQYEYDGEYYELVDYLSFDTAKPPPQAFQPPAGVECNDLTDDSTAPAAVLDTHGSIFAGFPGATLSWPSADAQKEENNLVNSPANVAAVAARAKTWVAAPQKVFDGLTFEQAAQRFLRKPVPMSLGEQQATRMRIKAGRTAHQAAEAAIPDEFNAAEQWPGCGIDVVHDQGSCGSCWAFGSTLALGERFCAAQNSSAPVVLSPQYAVSCFKDLMGCNGGYTDLAWVGLRDTGTVLDSCFEYQGRERACPRSCDDGSTPRVFKARDAYPLYSHRSRAETVKAIQRDILENGPVEAAFWVFQDFFDYAGGVYQRTKGSAYAGGHAVKIYGWGVDKTTGTPFWRVANSWGSDWGENGSFRIVRGSNECSIEDEVAAGRPLLG